MVAGRPKVSSDQMAAPVLEIMDGSLYTTSSRSQGPRSREVVCACEGGIRRCTIYQILKHAQITKAKSPYGLKS
jgi:hypothetical protein